MDHLRNFRKWFLLPVRSIFLKVSLWVFLLCLRIIWEPICWVTGRRPRHKPPKEIRRILFIALDNPGDILLTTPCLTALKEQFPSAEITVLAGEWSQEFLVTNPAVSKVITYNAFWFRSLVTHLRHRPFRPVHDFLRCLWHLWEERFDLAIETRGEAPHLLLAYLSGAPYRVGYAIRSLVPWLEVEKLASFLTHRVPYAWNRWLEWHRVDYNLQVVASLGAIPRDSSLVLSIPAFASERIRSFLEHNGVRETHFLIGVQPGASQERKRWSIRHFAKVLDTLIERWDGLVVVIGSKQEEVLARELASRMAHPPILAVGQTTLLEAAALIKRCQVVICNDSVVTHIASAVKTPVLTLSRSPSNFYAPYRTDGLALSRQLPCLHQGMPEGCLCPFSEYWCLQEVTPEEVLDAAEELLRSPAHCEREL